MNRDERRDRREACFSAVSARSAVPSCRLRPNAPTMDSQDRPILHEPSPSLSHGRPEQEPQDDADTDER